MIVVSNTSPLLHLARIGRAELLRGLYATILAPSAVIEEAVAGGAAALIAAAAAPGGWIVSSAVADRDAVGRLRADLGGAGEAEAIALAMERGADLLLVDERRARAAARAAGLAVAGTLACLVEAKRRGLLAEVRAEVERLKATGFWLDRKIVDAVLRAAGEAPP